MDEFEAVESTKGMPAFAADLASAISPFGHSTPFSPVGAMIKGMDRVLPKSLVDRER